VPAEAVSPTLSTDASTYAVGEHAVYTVTGAAGDQPIYFDAWLNGAPIASHVAVGLTDESGQCTITTTPFTDRSVGDWTIQAVVDGMTSNPVTFTVTP
jgi:hypothetical protein